MAPSKESSNPPIIPARVRIIKRNTRFNHVNSEIIIQDNTYSRGVLLPNIDGIDTVEEQIRIIKRKACIDQDVNKDLRYFRFETQKYY